MSNQNIIPDPAQLPKARWWETRRGHYFIGIGAGSLSLIVTLISLGNLSNSWAINLLIAAGIIYCLTWIVTIVCLAVDRVRFVGYGLLTMVLGIPVVAFLGCIVLITLPR